LLTFFSGPRAAALAAIVFLLATGAAVALTSAFDGGSRVDAGAARLFELHAPFRSWWYALSLYLLGLVGCAHLLRGSSELRAGAASSPLRLRSTFASPLDPDLVHDVLRRHGGRVREDDDGALSVERGAWRRYASFLRGAGALALAAAIALSAFTSERGLAFVPEGGTTYGFERPTPAGRVRFDLGAELQLERLDAAGSAGAPWRFTLTRGADVLARTDLAVGGSVDARGTRYVLAGARTGDTPGRFLVALGDAAPRTLAIGERLAAKDGGDLVVAGYEPALAPRAASGDEPAMSARPASLRVALVKKGAPTDVRTLFAGASDFDERVRRSESPLRFLGIERRAELVVRVERSMPPYALFAAGLVLLLGLLAGAGRRSVRFEASPSASGWIVRAESSHDSRALAAELDVVLAALHAAAGRNNTQGGTR